jgi:hypothetical protein
MDPSKESTDQEGEHSDPGNAEPTKSLPRSVVIFLLTGHHVLRLVRSYDLLHSHAEEAGGDQA